LCFFNASLLLKKVSFPLRNLIYLFINMTKAANAT